MAEIGKKTSVAVSRIAKIKTTLQMFAVGSLLLYGHPAQGTIFLIIGVILLYLAVGMTLWSMYMYLKVAWPDLTKKD